MVELKSLDLFSRPVNFRFDNRDKFKTTCGACVSYLLVISIGFYLMQELFYTLDGKIEKLRFMVKKNIYSSIGFENQDSRYGAFNSTVHAFAIDKFYDFDQNLGVGSKHVEDLNGALLKDNSVKTKFKKKMEEEFASFFSFDYGVKKVGDYWVDGVGWNYGEKRVYGNLNDVNSQFMIYNCSEMIYGNMNPRNQRLIPKNLKIFCFNVTLEVLDQGWIPFIDFKKSSKLILFEKTYLNKNSTQIRKIQKDVKKKFNYTQKEVRVLKKMLRKFRVWTFTKVDETDHTMPQDNLNSAFIGFPVQTSSHLHKEYQMVVRADLISITKGFFLPRTTKLKTLSFLGEKTAILAVNSEIQSSVVISMNLVLDQSQVTSISKTFFSLTSVVAYVGGFIKGITMFLLMIIYPIREVLFYKKLINTMFNVCLKNEDVRRAMGLPVFAETGEVLLESLDVEQDNYQAQNNKEPNSKVGSTNTLGPQKRSSFRRFTNTAKQGMMGIFKKIGISGSSKNLDSGKESEKESQEENVKESKTKNVIKMNPDNIWRRRGATNLDMMNIKAFFGDKKNQSKESLNKITTTQSGNRYADLKPTGRQKRRDSTRGVVKSQLQTFATILAQKRSGMNNMYGGGFNHLISNNLGKKDRNNPPDSSKNELPKNMIRRFSSDNNLLSSSGSSSLKSIEKEKYLTKQKQKAKIPMKLRENNRLSSEAFSKFKPARRMKTVAEDDTETESVASSKRGKNAQKKVLKRKATPGLSKFSVKANLQGNFSKMQSFAKSKKFLERGSSIVPPDVEDASEENTIKHGVYDFNPKESAFQKPAGDDDKNNQSHENSDESNSFDNISLIKENLAEREQHNPDQDPAHFHYEKGKSKTFKKTKTQAVQGKSNLDRFKEKPSFRHIQHNRSRVNNVMRVPLEEEIKEQEDMLIKAEIPAFDNQNLDSLEFEQQINQTRQSVLQYGLVKKQNPMNIPTSAKVKSQLRFSQRVSLSNEVQEESEAGGGEGPPAVTSQGKKKKSGSQRSEGNQSNSHSGSKKNSKTKRKVKMRVVNTKIEINHKKEILETEENRLESDISDKEDQKINSKEKLILPKQFLDPSAIDKDRQLKLNRKGRCMTSIDNVKSPTNNFIGNPGDNFLKVTHDIGRTASEKVLKHHKSPGGPKSAAPSDKINSRSIASPRSSVKPELRRKSSSILQIAGDVM